MILFEFVLFRNLFAASRVNVNAQILLFRLCNTRITAVNTSLFYYHNSYQLSDASIYVLPGGGLCPWQETTDCNSFR